MRWTHFVGGFYSPKKFLEEAKRIGVSRKCPPSVAKSMSLGDEVMVLEWRPDKNKTGGKAFHFASFQITGIFLDGKATQAVIDKLGLSAVPGSARTIVRECGSFVIGREVALPSGTPLRHVIEAAETAGPLKDLLIGGRITEELKPPVERPEIKSFFRGFGKHGPSASAPTKTLAIAGTLFGVEGYKPRTTIPRLDLELSLPIELPAEHPFARPAAALPQPVGIEGYKPRTTIPRLDLQLALPIKASSDRKAARREGGNGLDGR